MAKILDATPISVTRIRCSLKIEIIFSTAGALVGVNAQRYVVGQQAGVDISPPFYIGPTTFAAGVIPGTVQVQLLALAALIDSVDTAP